MAPSSGSKAAWERPLWFDTGAVPASEDRASKASRAGSTPSVSSTRRCASASALIDQTSFSKFEIEGPGAAAALDRIAANRIDRLSWRLRLHAALQ